MYNNFFTNCYIKKFLPLFGKFARLAGKNRLSEQTSKHPSLRPAPGCWQLFCQNRQASTNSYVSCCQGQTAGKSLVRTDKQAPCAAGQGTPSFVRTDKQARRILLPGWPCWETFVRTDKQAVIHRLSTVCG